jgi:hypothetical protein
MTFGVLRLFSTCICSPKWPFCPSGLTYHWSFHLPNVPSARSCDMPYLPNVPSARSCDMPRRRQPASQGGGGGPHASSHGDASVRGDRGRRAAWMQYLQLRVTQRLHTTMVTRVWTETCDCISGSELDHQWCPMILFPMHPDGVKLETYIKHFEPAAYSWGTLIQASQPRRRPVSLPWWRPAQAEPALEAFKSPSKWLKGKRVTLGNKYLCLDQKRVLIHQMSWKSRSQRFKSYFYEDDVWIPISAKRIVWRPKSAIFSL